MGIFEQVVKNVKKKKKEPAIFPVVSLEIVDNRFDFEKKSQADLSRAKRAQNNEYNFDDIDTVYDLNDIYWVFISETIKDNSGKVSFIISKAIPFYFTPKEKKVVDLVQNRTFKLEDVTAGSKIRDARAKSDDMILFSFAYEKRNYRVWETGEVYDLKNKDPVDSYNPGSPSLIKLITKTFEGTDFSKILESRPSGMCLKLNALVSKRDILKINQEIQNTYTKQRLNTAKKNERLSRKVF